MKFAVNSGIQIMHAQNKHEIGQKLISVEWVWGGGGRVGGAIIHFQKTISNWLLEVGAFIPASKVFTSTK